MHAPTCGCSVCWAHNYCDALKLFPLTETELSRPFINYYAYTDYTAQFKREQRTSAQLSGPVVRYELLGRDLSGPYRLVD